MSDKPDVVTSQALQSLTLSQILKRNISDTYSYISDFGTWRVGLFKKFWDNRPIVHFALFSLKNNESACIRLWPTFDHMGSLEVFYSSEKNESRTIRYTKTSPPTVYSKDYMNSEYANYSTIVDSLKMSQPNFRLIGGVYIYHSNIQSYSEYPRRLFIYDSDTKFKEIEWSIFLRDASNSNHSILLEYEKTIRDHWFSSKYTCIQLDLGGNGLIGQYSRVVHTDKFWGTRKHQFIEFDKLFKNDKTP